MFYNLNSPQWYSLRVREILFDLKWENDKYTKENPESVVLLLVFSILYLQAWIKKQKQ